MRESVFDVYTRTVRIKNLGTVPEFSSSLLTSQVFRAIECASKKR
jgi:hypothetical protein